MVVELELDAYGVGHADEGVCLLVRLGPYRVLLDCGLTDMTPLLRAIDQGLHIDLVLCSHAHSDHARGLLELYEARPQIPIYASEATSQLIALNWLGKTEQPIPSFCQALPWRSPVEFRDGLMAELFPAGHLPGAAAFLLHYTARAQTYTLLYTGDCLLSNSRLVDGFVLEELRGLKPNVLVVEGSYGTTRYARRRQQENHLAEKIIQALNRHQSVVLPVPTLGLGQELLMLLRSHHQFTGRDLDIWVAGKVATACDLYLELLPHLPTAAQNFAQHQPLFWDDRVRPRVRRLTASDLRAPFQQSPCVVLTDYSINLQTYYRQEAASWLILLPQYPGQAKPSIPFIAPPPVPDIETYLLAEHCDGPSTTQLIHNLRPQHVVLVHGDPNYLADLAGLEELYNRYHLHTPAVGARVELPIGEVFIQPPPIETRYEGELTEMSSGVTVNLPPTVTTDPRWQQFADTGLVIARWQGEELVLRGLSQWELLNQMGNRPISQGLECCANCQYFRSQHCRNSASPLFEMKVTPEGYCPAFEMLAGRSGESS